MQSDSMSGHQSGWTPRTRRRTTETLWGSPLLFMESATADALATSTHITPMSTPVARPAASPEFNDLHSDFRLFESFAADGLMAAAPAASFLDPPSVADATAEAVLAPTPPPQSMQLDEPISLTPAQRTADTGLRRAICSGALSPLRRALDKHADHASASVLADARRFRERLRYRAKRAAKNHRRANPSAGFGSDAAGAAASSSASAGTDAPRQPRLSSDGRASCRVTSSAGAAAWASVSSSADASPRTCTPPTSAFTSAFTSAHTSARPSRPSSPHAARHAGTCAAPPMDAPSEPPPPSQTASASNSACTSANASVSSCLDTHGGSHAGGAGEGGDSVDVLLGGAGALGGDGALGGADALGGDGALGGADALSARTPEEYTEYDDVNIPPDTISPSISPEAHAAASAALEHYNAILRSALPPEAFCPLTLSLMSDPVVTDDGICYERVAITEWLATHGTSPTTEAPLPSQRLTPAPIIIALTKALISAAGPSVAAAAAAHAAAHATISDASTTTTRAIGGSARGRPDTPPCMAPDTPTCPLRRAHRAPRRAPRVTREASRDVLSMARRARYAYSCGPALPRLAPPRGCRPRSAIPFDCWLLRLDPPLTLGPDLSSPRLSSPCPSSPSPLPTRPELFAPPPRPRTLPTSTPRGAETASTPMATTTTPTSIPIPSRLRLWTRTRIPL